MKPVQRHSLFFLGLLLLAGTSCGYRLEGEGFSPFPGIRSISIPTFTNETYEPGIETIFTNALLKEFIKDRRIKVLGQGEADAVMEGTVRSFKTRSVAYDPTGVVLEYRTWITLDIIVKRTRTGEVLWSERDLLESDTYRVSSVVRFNEEQKEGAIQVIAGKLAGRIRRGFFQGM
jgi:hypothetical protein